MWITQSSLLRIGFITLVLFAFALYSPFIYPSYLLLPVFLTVLLATLLALSFFRRHFDVFEPVTLFSLMYSGFVLSAAYSLSNNALIPEMNVYGKSAAHMLIATLLALIIGLIMFYAGYFPNVRKAFKAGGDKAFPVQEVDLSRQMTVLILSFSVIGFLGYYALYVRPMGGFMNLISLFGRTKAKALETGASSMFTPLYWCAFLLWYRYYLDGRRTILFWPYMAFVLFTQFVRGRILGGVVTPILMLLVIWRYSPSGRDKKISVGAVLIGCLAIAVLAFAVYGYRKAAVYQETDAARDYVAEVLSPAGFAESILATNNLPGIIVTTQILQGVPEDIPYQYGRTFLFLFDKFVPNRLAPQRESKPTVGAMVKEAWYSPWRGNIPPTFVGELYLNFGWAGIVIGMYLLGRACAHLYERLVLRHNDWFIVIYAALVTNFVFLLPKGEFADHMFGALWGTVLPIVISLVIARFLRLLERAFWTRDPGHSIASSY